MIKIEIHIIGDKIDVSTTKRIFSTTKEEENHQYIMKELLKAIQNTNPIALNLK